jgi:hypothetical protein
MATFDSILTPAQTTATVISGLTSGASTVEQTLGWNTIFAINATQDITIKFGPPGFSALASAADFRIPANSTMVWDNGTQYTSFKCFNLSGSVCNVYIMFLSKF